MSNMNYVQAMAALRAAGALMVASYTEMARTAGPVTEAEIKAAEDAILKPAATPAPHQPPQPPKVPGAVPGSDTVTAGGTTRPSAQRIEHFPGVFYTPDTDPTRGDIMEGQAAGALPLFRFVDAGYNVNSFGPINRKWKTNSMYAPIFGTGKNGIWDSSNGHDCIPPQPGYSPNGWPIHYTHDGSGPRSKYALGMTGKVIGTGTLMYDDKSFSNDAEVAAYIAAQATVEASKPPPAPTISEMKSKYPSKAAFQADAELFPYAVKLDNEPLPVLGSKFGPALSFFSWADGTIRNTKQQGELPLDQGEVIDL